ncbi:unnamed protein product [Amoebophrya sp. A25]|nr:unnamed protein product [Amoebophrya sp. A25]|eukprot:GSA25T00012649001.1
MADPLGALHHVSRATGRPKPGMELTGLERSRMASPQSPRSEISDGSRLRSMLFSKIDGEISPHGSKHPSPRHGRRDRDFSGTAQLQFSSSRRYRVTKGMGSPKGEADAPSMVRRDATARNRRSGHDPDGSPRGSSIRKRRSKQGSSTQSPQEAFAAAQQAQAQRAVGAVLNHETFSREMQKAQDNALLEVADIMVEGQEEEDEGNEGRRTSTSREAQPSPRPSSAAMQNKIEEMIYRVERATVETLDQELAPLLDLAANDAEFTTATGVGGGHDQAEPVDKGVEKSADRLAFEEECGDYLATDGAVDGEFQQGRGRYQADGRGGHQQHDEQQFAVPAPRKPAKSGKALWGGAKTKIRAVGVVRATMQAESRQPLQQRLFKQVLHTMKAGYRARRMRELDQNDSATVDQEVERGRHRILQLLRESTVDKDRVLQKQATKRQLEQEEADRRNKAEKKAAVTEDSKTKTEEEIIEDLCYEYFANEVEIDPTGRGKWSDNPACIVPGNVLGASGHEAILGVNPRLAQIQNQQATLLETRTRRYELEDIKAPGINYFHGQTSVRGRGPLVVHGVEEVQEEPHDVEQEAAPDPALVPTDEKQEGVEIIGDEQMIPALVTSVATPRTTDKVQEQELLVGATFSTPSHQSRQAPVPSPASQQVLLLPAPSSPATSCQTVSPRGLFSNAASPKMDYDVQGGRARSQTAPSSTSPSRTNFYQPGYNYQDYNGHENYYQDEHERNKSICIRDRDEARERVSPRRPRSVHELLNRDLMNPRSFGVMIAKVPPEPPVVSRLDEIDSLNVGGDTPGPSGLGQGQGYDMTTRTPPRSTSSPPRSNDGKRLGVYKPGMERPLSDQRPQHVERHPVSSPMEWPSTSPSAFHGSLTRQARFTRWGKLRAKVLLQRHDKILRLHDTTNGPACTDATLTRVFDDTRKQFLAKEVRKTNTQIREADTARIQKINEAYHREQIEARKKARASMHKPMLVQAPENNQETGKDAAGAKKEDSESSDSSSDEEQGEENDFPELKKIERSIENCYRAKEANFKLDELRRVFPRKLDAYLAPEVFLMDDYWLSTGGSIEKFGHLASLQKKKEAMQDLLASSVVGAKDNMERASFKRALKRARAAQIMTSGTEGTKKVPTSSRLRTVITKDGVIKPPVGANRTNKRTRNHGGAVGSPASTALAEPDYRDRGKHDLKKQDTAKSRLRSPGSMTAAEKRQDFMTYLAGKHLLESPPGSPRATVLSAASSQSKAKVYRRPKYMLDTHGFQDLTPSNAS